MIEVNISAMLCSAVNKAGQGKAFEFCDAKTYRTRESREFQKSVSFYLARNSLRHSDVMGAR